MKPLLPAIACPSILLAGFSSIRYIVGTKTDRLTVTDAEGRTGRIREADVAQILER